MSSGALAASLCIVAACALLMAAMSAPNNMDTELVENNQLEMLHHQWCNTIKIPYPKWSQHKPENNVLDGSKPEVYKWRKGVKGWPTEKRKYGQSGLAC
mmetsp:Transcript_18202/g.42803  ORF Transcript_18202/g.42803 Transcript_18202/m.42803 type:complete len:99 (+) Transcript_18202:28-324(+)